MKKIQKAALTAVLFTAAMNMNSCAYGPPPDEAAMKTAAMSKENSYSIEEADATVNDTDDDIIADNNKM